MPKKHHIPIPTLDPLHLDAVSGGMGSPPRIGYSNYLMESGDGSNRLASYQCFADLEVNGAVQRDRRGRPIRKDRPTPECEIRNAPFFPPPIDGPR